MDDFERLVRSMVAREQIDEHGLDLEAICSLDPMLFDRLRDAIEETYQDPEDLEAHDRFVCAFAGFLAAVAENLPDRR